MQSVLKKHSHRIHHKDHSGTRKKIAAAFIYLLCGSVPFLASAPLAMAQSLDPTDEFDVQKLEESWSPGERYSGLKGTMDYAHTDLYLPGNGNLPIEITRMFRQSRSGGVYSASASFGMMYLSTPRIYYINKSGGSVVCTDSGQTTSSNSLDVPITFLHGEGQTIFFGGDGGSGEFKSPDGWKIECTPNSNGTVTRNGNMVVHSPEGITYEMYSNTILASVYSNLIVKKVTDQYGNTLTYNYHDPSDAYETEKRLDSIVASDGRKVSISYKKVSVRNGRNEINEVDRIDTITTNSSSNPVSLKYAYSDRSGMTITESDAATTSINYSNGKLSSITYPTGGTVNYTYSGKVATAGASYDQLSSRTTSDGSSYNFSHLDNGDSTFTRTIKTPSALLEYQYGEATATRRHNKPQNYTINSGRLMKSTRSTLSGNRLLEVDYAYLTLYSVSSLVRQDSDFVAPESTTYGMNFNAGSSTPASVFTTNYEEYDDFGYLTRMQEVGPDEKAIDTTYTYRHNNFSKYIIGKLASETTTGDSQTYEYNQLGDVERHSDNGVITTYQWYESGSDRGEMSSMTQGSGRTTTYSRYKRGQAQHIRNPSNYGKIQSVNDNGSVAFESRYTENLSFDVTHRPVAAYQYDPLRRLILSDPARSESVATQQTWQNNNNVRIFDEANQRFERFERLDGFGRTVLKASRDKDQQRWSSVRYRYDSEGRLVYESYPENKSVDEMMSSNSNIGIAYQYDSLNRLAKVTHTEAADDQSAVTYQYGQDSGKNLVISQTDGRGSKTSTSYLSFGNPNYRLPITIKGADGTTTSLVRFPHTGRLSSITRAGTKIVYDYNSKGQVSSINQKENGITSFTYYDDGLLKTRNNKDRVISYEYYLDGRLKREQFSDSSTGSVTREYIYDSYMNLESLITTSQDGTQDNTLKYTYDAGDNVTSQELVVDGLSYRVQYAYDELSSLSSITYPNSRNYSLKPNGFGLPTHIHQQDGKAKVIYDEIRYNNNNSMKELTRNGGHQIKNSLTPGQRPSRYRVAQYGDGRTASFKENVYSYDKANNVSRINDAVNSQYSTFGYDSSNRLTQANLGGSTKWEFSYLNTDDIDTINVNGELSKYEYDPVTRQLMRIASQSNANVVRRFEYDSHGNMQRHERLKGPQTVVRMDLVFNAANQLVKTSDGTGYEYDGRGLRVKKDLSGPIYTMYDKDQKLIFRDDTGTGVTSEYFYVDGKLVARRDEDTGGLADDVTGPDEDVSEPTDDVGGPDEDVSEPTDDVAEPDENVSEPIDDVVEPDEDASEPIDDVVEPDEDVSELADDSAGLTEEDLEIPSTLQPAGNSVGPKPGYKWVAVSGATDYDIDVRKADSDLVLKYQSYNDATAGCSGGTGDCEVKSPHGSDLSGDYRWRVRSKNDTNESQWSDWRIFSVGN